MLDAAQERATVIGVGADRVLIAAGTIGEEAYLRALGARLGIGFEPLDELPRQLCLIDDERLIATASLGLLPISQPNGGKRGTTLVVSPRGTAARRILQMVETDATLARHFRFTSAERLNHFVLRHASTALTARATGRLREQWPALSAAPMHRSIPVVPTMAFLALFVATMAFMFDTALHGLALLLAGVFLAWLGLRLMTAGIKVRELVPTPVLPAHELPVYTIIIALYREAASVDGLLSAIERLDYPAEKLDVIITIEADDAETRAALAARVGRLPVTLVTVPIAGPRTKPKALNTGLPFARGTFTAIYDAEDRPEPGQLRQALHAFYAGGERLACVQAPLSIDNTADGWLARLFTAEYAGQFDVFLPGLASMGLPLPLGGSSNHFRTEALRALGAWDPYNVTEDADLGMRLARFGYRASTFAATTYEEAPARLMPWLRQRTRWFKGWARTWVVHMRAPRRLRRELGWPGFIAFQLIVGGNVLAALVHPLFLASLLDALLNEDSGWTAETGGLAFLPAFYAAMAVAGYLVSALLAILGLARCRLWGTAWVLLLMPAHWLLLSAAAWRALYQLVVAPYDWEKTAHGLAKTSRRANALTRSLVELERHLRWLEQTGQLPAFSAERKATAPR